MHVNGETKWMNEQRRLEAIGSTNLTLRQRQRKESK